MYFILNLMLHILTFIVPNKEKYYCIIDKGIYVNASKNKKIKIPYKVHNFFYFEINSDTTAIIQEVKDDSLYQPINYKISSKVDTIFFNRRSIVNGKSINILEKKTYQKVYR